MKQAFERAVGARLPGGRARAFFSSLAMLVVACALAPFARAQESVCAEVKIEIKQTVTLERQAFDAVLKIRNGLSIPVEALDVELRFADAAGTAVPGTTNPDDTAAKFFFRTDGATGISGELTGSGVVAPASSGEAHWLIVPTASAGGQTAEGIAYRIGAKITYRMGSETKTVEVTPDTITVKPQPKLRLDYFLTRHVYGDDPFTPQSEPLVPFTLGVRVWNYGYGRANAVAIESGQPEIRKGGNPQGLLVDFRILDAYVDDAPAQPSLTAQFGGIAAGTAKMGRWNMTVSLSGIFFNFVASIRHADEFGGALTSLIAAGDIKAHDLVHDVLADAPGRDGIRDFLAYDADVLNLYESDGGLVAGSAGATSVTEVSGALAGGGNTRQLTVAAVPGGFAYVKIADPFNGQLDTMAAVRGDGKVLPPANAWFSKERDATAEKWNYFINVFDFHDAAAGQVTYRLDTSTTPARPASLRGAVFEDVDGDGVRGAEEPAMFDVGVTLDGIADAGHAVSRTLRTDALGGFGFLDVPPGTYRLGVGVIAGYRNGLHAAGTAGGTVTSADIAGIVLASGANADGYAFAKTQQGPVTRQADIAIASLGVVDPPRVVIGRPFTFRVQVRSDGPDDVPAAVRVVLGPGIQFDGATPSAGQFDEATGRWRVGLLPAGTMQSLDLSLRANTGGLETIQATAVVDDPQAVDPQPANNYGSAQIDVKKPADYRIDAAIDDAPRVLVLSTCVTDDGGGPIEWLAARAVQAAGECVFGRALAIDALFAAQGVTHLVVHGEAAFLDQLRSGQWNTYWIDAGAAALLGDATNRELAQALLRGEWTIVDQPHLGLSAPNAGVARLEAYVPAALDVEGPVLQQVQRVEVAESDWLPAGFLAAGPTYDLYRSLGADAQVLAAFDMGPTLRPAALYRINRTLLFGFDFFSALSEASPAYRTQAMSRLLGATRPSRETVFEAGRYVTFKGGITAWDPIDATVAFRTPADVERFAFEPAADVALPSYLSWRRQLAPRQSLAVALVLRLPVADAPVLPLSFEVTSADREPDEVSLGGIVVDVRTAGTQADGVGAALGTLGAADAAAMRALLDQARLDYAAHRYGSAIRKLLDIADAVDDDWRTGGTYAAPLARELGRLILWWQRKWAESPAVCGPDPGVENTAGRKAGASLAGNCPNAAH